MLASIFRSFKAKAKLAAISKPYNRLYVLKNSNTRVLVVNVNTGGLPFLIKLGFRCYDLFFEKKLMR